MGGSRPHTAWGSLRPSSSAFTAHTATASSLRFAQICTLTHVRFVQIWRLHRSWWSSRAEQTALLRMLTPQEQKVGHRGVR